MKKIAFLIALVSFSLVVNAGNEDLLRDASDDVYELLNVKKSDVANTILRVHRGMIESDILRPNFVTLVVAANAAMEESMRAEFTFSYSEYDRHLEKPFKVYPKSFADVINIWAGKKTPVGPASWQLLANVLHAEFTFYVPSLWDDNVLETVRGPGRSISSELEGAPRPVKEYHIGVIQTENGVRYVLFTPNKKLKR
jgi:hypothetical protein